MGALMVTLLVYNLLALVGFLLMAWGLAKRSLWISRGLPQRHPSGLAPGPGLRLTGLAGAVSPGLLKGQTENCSDPLP